MQENDVSKSENIYSYQDKINGKTREGIEKE